MPWANRPWPCLRVRVWAYFVLWPYFFANVNFSTLCTFQFCGSAKRKSAHPKIFRYEPGSSLKRLLGFGVVEWTGSVQRFMLVFSFPDSTICLIVSTAQHNTAP